jgi:ABC-type phosphate/phosphonate transport system ATPase subunit
MLKRKYPQLNIFMLDEVLSSLDNDKIYDVLGVLRNTVKELNMNIFVIHQAALPNEYFDYSISIFKNSGFSDLKIQKFENGD